MTAMVRSLPLGSLWRRGWLMLPLAAFCLAAPGAQAQSVDDQLQRLQRELSDLQRQVYSGQTPPAAAGDGGGGLAPTQAARIQLQLDEMGAQLRELTGRIEDMGFRIESTSDRLDRLVADVDLRLRNLEEGGLPPVGAMTPAEEPGTAMAAETPADQPAGALSPARPGTIGSISESDLSSFQQQQAAQPQVQQQAQQQAGQQAAAPAATAALPGGTPQQKYDYAFGLLRQANYAGAEQAFAAFLSEHPQDALAGNAKYWLGETFYVRGDYQQAAVTFAEGFETYPNNSKAPDNLLKLGMSLASLGSTEDACGTFAVLLDRYADAPATILSRAQRESQRLGCR
ncbi:MAG: tol-pal system protein YbgF [Kiloniellaceae bacterium]